MGRSVIKQPDGLYAVFSTGTDRWIATDMTRDQYIERQSLLAAQEARTDAARLLDDVDAGLVYGGYTFEEANAASVESGGEDLSGKLTVQEAVATADVRPARLSADLTMSDGRTVHVPVVPPAKEPAARGKIKVEIPYPADAAAGFVASAAVTNVDLPMTFRRDLWDPEAVDPYASIGPGDTLTVEFGEESLDAGAIARVFGEWP
jgi:hypothetical protein